MNSQRSLLLRILSDLAALTTLGAGGFIMTTVVLIMRGWTPRQNLDASSNMLTKISTNVIWTLGPTLTMWIGLMLTIGGGGVLLLGKRSNAIWLAMTLIVVSMLWAHPHHPIIDGSMVACCLAGWFAQFLPITRKTVAS